MPRIKVCCQLLWQQFMQMVQMHVFPLVQLANPPYSRTDAISLQNRHRAAAVSFRFPLQMLSFQAPFEIPHLLMHLFPENPPVLPIRSLHVLAFCPARVMVTHPIDCQSAFFRRCIYHITTRAHAKGIDPSVVLKISGQLIRSRA